MAKNTFDLQIKQLEKMIADNSAALSFFRKVRDEDAISVKEAIKIGCVYAEINEGGKFTIKELTKLPETAVLRGIETVRVNTIRCNNIDE